MASMIKVEGMRLKVGEGDKRRGKKGGENGRKDKKKCWGTERRVGQESAKQIDIWTEWKWERG
jgi:hypothetical protein